MRKFLETLRKIFSPARISTWGDQIPYYVKILQTISNDSKL